MGDNGIKRTDEDELCAIHIRNRLEGRPGDPDAIRKLILAGGEVGRFRDPSRPYLHPEDVERRSRYRPLRFRGEGRVGGRATCRAYGLTRKAANSISVLLITIAVHHQPSGRSRYFSQPSTLMPT
jgi:hypothetical protein